MVSHFFAKEGERNAYFWKKDRIRHMPGAMQGKEDHKNRVQRRKKIS
jgi:hypothetical protein